MLFMVLNIIFTYRADFITATNAVLWHIAADLILPAMGDLWISSYKFHYKI